jgi:hypothetical protein
MRRDPFQDRLTFVNDTRQVVGIGLATQSPEERAVTT